MTKTSNWKKAWELLNPRERTRAILVLIIVSLSALSSAAMVGSIYPFLSVLTDAGRIRSEPSLAWAYDAGSFSSDYSFLVALGLTSLAIIILASILQILSTWAISRFATMRIHSLSHKLLAKYLSQPYEFFLNRHTGEMSTQVLAETQVVANQFFRPAAAMLSAILSVTAIVVVLLFIDPVVALIVFFVLGGLYGGTLIVCRRMIQRLGQMRAEVNKSRFRFTHEALNGIKDIKLLGREASYLDRFDVPSKRMAETITLVQILGSLPHYVMQAVGFGGIIVFCLVMLDPKGLETGQSMSSLLPLLGVFAFAGQRLLPELSKIYVGMTQINFGAASLSSIHQDLTSSRSAPMVRDMPAPLGMKKDLVLEGTCYTYPNTDAYSVREITLTIRAGERVGIVGSTGAGKTTFADLILGLLQPTSGLIRADDITITDKNLRSWQQTVGYVPQDIFLIDASIIENIALGVPLHEIDHERVKEVAQSAQLTEFITTELADQYQTLIGERGVRLSGGQRQRIGIARALYHHADLIVFDEATSALDNLTERDVMTAIEALPGDKTVLMIAHRLSTVKACDRIVVLDKGRLVGIGRWDDLMQGNPYFRRIANMAEEV
jgi:ABC-type multidrug transport system fused ATPase/permease subunit